MRRRQSAVIIDEVGIHNETLLDLEQCFLFDGKFLSNKKRSAEDAQLAEVKVVASDSCYTT